MKFNLGDKVRIRPGLINPHFGWSGRGKDSRGELYETGTITEVRAGAYTVNFPSYSTFSAVDDDLILAEAAPAVHPPQFTLPLVYKVCFVKPDGGLVSAIAGKGSYARHAELTYAEGTVTKTSDTSEIWTYPNLSIAEADAIAWSKGENCGTRGTYVIHEAGKISNSSIVLGKQVKRIDPPRERRNVTAECTLKLLEGLPNGSYYVKVIHEGNLILQLGATGKRNSTFMPAGYSVENLPCNVGGWEGFNNFTVWKEG